MNGCFYLRIRRIPPGLSAGTLGIHVWSVDVQDCWRLDQVTAVDRYRTCGGPRERLLMNGAHSLSDVELIAILLGTGSVTEPVGVVAARLLDAVGGLEQLQQLSIGAMVSQVGVGPTKACRLQAAIELGRRAVARPLSRGERISCSKDVYEAFYPLLAKENREHFIAIALDTKNRPIAENEIAVGGLNICAMEPADIFRVLLRETSSAAVLVHNHPSGEPSPSIDDVAFTRRIRRAGQLLGIQILDHIIIGEQGYFSFLDSGLIPHRSDFQKA